jgi:soluble lytic murein transglycosylase-like protein
MTDEISRITARISDIQERIAALSGPAATPIGPAAAPAAPDARPTFAKALTTAQALPPIAGPTYLPEGSSVPAPPASLGPLPPLPVAPGAANVVPLPQTASADMEGIIQKYAAQNGVAPALVRAVIKTESDGNPHCVSRAGAIGLMQLMPANVREAGISDPFDPEQNIAAGTKQLAGLMAQYGGNLDLALAGYNAGPGNVHKYGGVPPFVETQNYIRRVRAAMEKG